MMQKEMRHVLDRMISDYNGYAYLVAYNRLMLDKYKCGCDDGTLQWNRGHLCAVNDYLNDIAAALGVTLKNGIKSSPVVCNGIEIWISYQTVSVVQDQ